MTVNADKASEALTRWERYQRIRTLHNLPRCDRSVTADGVLLRFAELPAPANYASLTIELCCDALARLASLESSWGSPLHGLPHASLLHDPTRAVFTVGPGLFEDDAPESAVSALLARLNVSPGATVSLAAAAILVSVRYPQLAVVLTPGDAGERVRALVDEAGKLCENQPLAAAVVLRAAWRLRPGDVQVGLLWLSIEVRLANASDTPELDVVARELFSRDAGNPEVLTALAIREERAAQFGAAARLAAAATAIDATRPGAWAVRARVAQRAGDAEQLEIALDGLAAAGEPAAVVVLARLRGVGSVGHHLDRWHVPWTTDIARLRLRWLHQQDRLRELVQFFFANAELLHPLTEADVGLIADAGERLPGRLRSIRDRLRTQIDTMGASPALVHAYVRVCDREGVQRAILDAYRHWPDMVAAEFVVPAAAAERDWPLVRRLTQDGALPHYRLLAVVRDALTRGTPALHDELIHLANVLNSAGDIAYLDAELVELRRAAPAAAITGQLIKLRGEFA